MSRCSPRSGLVKNALTFDVEEYFHAEAFARVLRPEELLSQPKCVPVPVAREPRARKWVEMAIVRFLRLRELSAALGGVAECRGHRGLQ